MYRAYNHVMRLDNVDVEGLLDGPVTISYKIDGTNSCIWSENGEVKAGSRNRELSLTEDNAGFYNWILNGNTSETKFLTRMVIEHPNLIIYGEWLGSRKFIGSIKAYDKDALGHLWVFDVYDVESKAYLPEQEWRSLFDTTWSMTEPYPYQIPFLEVQNPTKESLLEIAKDNHFLLEHTDRLGEGIVIRRKDYRNKYGRYEIGKLVLEEYIQSKKKKTPIPSEGMEADIINEMVTDYELSKAVAKIENVTGEEFSNSNNKHIGRYMNEVWEGCILDEMKTILKKYKMPTIDFKVLRRTCDAKARGYIFPSLS